VDGIALVQSWINDGAANYGIIIADSVTTNGADFDSGESSTAISRPRLEVSYTVPVNIPPTASFTDSCTDLDCDFTDTSTDSDGSVTGWSWDFGDGNGSTAQHPSHSYAAGGTYTVELTATDNEGATDVTSSQVSVSLTPSVTDVVAIADLFGSGTVSGTYADTQSDDGDPQSIYERESGGKKRNRYSFLIHTWQFNLPANAMATVYANAWSGGSTDDDFRFSWSSDNNSYTEMFTVSSTDAANMESFVLPADTSGTLYVRVEDTDRTAGNRTRDTVFIDHLYIRAESGNGEPPAAPSSLLATTAGADRIDLAWTHNGDDEAGFKVERSLDGSNFAEVGTTGSDDTNYSDTGLDASTTYWYRVRAWNASGDSGWSNIDLATTDDPPPPPAAPGSLVATTAGSSSIDLAWLDNSFNEDGFDIERSVDGINFGPHDTVAANVTVYPDAGLSPNTTYWYRVNAFNVSGPSGYSNTDSATTDPAPSISLSLNGYKIKGRHVIDLDWSGTTGTDVDIYRDGGLYDTVADTGAYTDQTGNKGSRSYDYQVCEAGTANCSAVQSVSY
jgi:PKD repeat protein